MGHDYGVPLRFLSVTPTRDNDVAPGNRLQDKHSRLFHGKTLDEWTMIQLWSSKYLGRAVFVCETEAHRDKLEPMAAKYGVSLFVRPKDMLHFVNDSGGVPILWGVRRALEQDYYSLLTMPFVVAPCRPPGFFDMLVEEYLKLATKGLDWTNGHLVVIGGYEVDGAPFQIDENHVATQIGTVTLNKNMQMRYSAQNHHMYLMHWYLAIVDLSNARHGYVGHPTFVDIPPWVDIHIDTQDQWDEAEFWFGKKILSQGEDCYERYRATWATD